MLVNLLESILCVLMQIPYFFLWAIITAANAVIVGLAAVVAGALALLPDMPDGPTLPEWLTDGAGYLAWFFPTGTVVDIFAFVVVAWVSWQVVVIALRWAKATSE